MRALFLHKQSAGKYYYSETPPGYTIVDLFEDGYNDGRGGIAIAPDNHKLVQGKMVPSNIRINNNVFKMINPSVLNAHSVDGLEFTSNHILYADFIKIAKMNL